MKPSTRPLFSTVLIAAFVCCLIATPKPARAGSAEIRIDVAHPTVELSPHLYGLFFEDINYAADGGLYAELVQNRSFEYHPLGDRGRASRMDALFAWEKVAREGAEVELEVVDDRPVHKNNPHYLEVEIDKQGVAGVSNAGFEGIHVDEGATYRVAVHARAGSGWRGDAQLTAHLETADGQPLGSVDLGEATGRWQHLEATITADQTTDDARLLVTTAGRGTLMLDMVSLFPTETFNGHKNGLRPDLAQALKDLNPQFLRFPGGCISHGDGLANAYRWKDTVGPIEHRKPNFNTWGYHQTYGLGFFEYFQLCEDLNMEALPVVPVGVSCGFRGLEVVPMDELQPWIDEAVDLIEFANGPVTSEWGKLRADMGHPEPFNLKFICLGNEEHDTAAVRERFPHFVKAIRDKYPDIKIIGTSGLGPGIPIYDQMTELDVYSSDEHYYEDPTWFIANQNRFDDFDRDRPLIFVGEYASRGSTLFNALAEAAYLTGIERNADIVDMTCYAPLFGRDGHTQWNPDMIYFNKRDVVRTANYYVQQLFAQNKGDVYLPNSVELHADQELETIAGRVGIGSWSTEIELESFTVNGETLDPGTWNVITGDFEMNDGNYVQSDGGAQPALSISPEDFEGEEVTITARVKVNDGAEGFLVRFGADDRGRDGFWFNVGGWGNSRHAIEAFQGRSKAEVTARRGRIEQDRWYDAKVVLTPGSIKTYLDGELVNDYAIDPIGMSVSTTLDKKAGEVIVKLVNPTDEAIDANIHLDGVGNVESQADMITLAGNADATNTFENPDAVAPQTETVAVGNTFEHTIPAMSLQIIRVKLAEPQTAMRPR